MDIEKVIIIAVNTEQTMSERFVYSVEELKSLTKTADGEVMHLITQNRKSPHRATYVGEGKLEEIKELCETDEIDVVIINDELSGSQIRNITEILDVKVIDRSQLILDIFASRARTKEGKLQVELAQYAYMLPRLHGQGANLSRLGGGIGTRGPGETKLETDRRHIQKRMDELKARLDVVVNQREQYRLNRKRNKLFQIAIVGYTNAGKSTLFNKLTSSDSLQEDKLFATLDPLTRKMRLKSGLNVAITDTVGFIQDLPTALIAAFRSTLEEVKEADLILHVIDVNAPDKEDHEKTVLQLLEELDANEIPLITIYNKKDLINEENFVANSQPSLLVSAFEEKDLDKIKVSIEERIQDIWLPYSIFVEENNGNLLSRLQNVTLVTKEEYVEEAFSYKVQGFVNKNHPIMKEIKE
ncbi:GTPase HflX [Gracilibacillus marinus]|uniref:GTPase HflX n=1 Tax=Gracilibacillus marinus TaxID=630535 RepID=A0ABV8VXG7_9BACI